MGRHSRRGRAGKGDTGELPKVPAPGAEPRPASGPASASGAASVPGTGPGTAPEPGPGLPQGAVRGALGPLPPRLRRPATGGTPSLGVPRAPDGTPAHGFPRFQDGTPAQGVPRYPDGTPARGVPRYPDGTPAHGVPRLPDGTPAHGIPRMADGTPVRGVPRLPDGIPARGVPRVRGEHPEQRESGGGWGEFEGGPRPMGDAYNGPRAMPRGGPQGAPAGAPGPRIPRQRQEPGAGFGTGPRQAYVDAFDEGEDGNPEDADGNLFVRRPRAAHRNDPYAPVTDRSPADVDGPLSQAEDAEDAGKEKSGKGRAFTGIAAAAVTTVLAVVVAGQVATGRHDATAQTQSRSTAGGGLDALGSAAPGGSGATPSVTPSAKTLTYDQKMGEKYALGPKLKGSGKFDAVTGFAKAPGKGQKYTYRVDVEQGLGLDAGLFAQAVQKTLNDKRSWAHNGARTFERIYSGKPDFVITLASPGTTAEWCAKSGLDTTEDNVSCDSAATERVMINAYRWAQGSRTYGDAIHPYRQMLINHEVGHRLGYGHVTCDKDGELAPVMQQQTKFLDHDGIHCLANPWPYPAS